MYQPTTIRPLWIILITPILLFFLFPQQVHGQYKKSQGIWYLGLEHKTFIYGKFNDAGSETYATENLNTPCTNCANRGETTIQPYSNKEPAVATEGALIATYNQLRWYNFNMDAASQDRDDVGSRYNNFGVWATDVNLYRLSSKDAITYATRPFLNKNAPGGIGYNVAKENVLKLIYGTESTNPDLTFSGWVFVGDIGPDRSYTITLLHNWGRYGTGHTKVRSWRTYSGRTSKLKNVASIFYERGKKSINWKKGTNYDGNFLKFEIYRKRIDQSGDGQLIATIHGTSGKSDYSFLDRDVNNEIGDYTYTIYTLMSDEAPSDWRKSRDAAERGKTINVKYRNTGFEVSQSLKGRIRLEWKSFENISGLDKIYIFKDVNNNNINNATPVARMSKVSVSYVDEDAIPGMFHNYNIRLFDSHGKDITASSDIELDDLEATGTSLKNGRISGSVKTANGVPISGVRVDLQSVYQLNNGQGSSRYETAQAYTDNTGYYEMYNVFYADSATFNLTASFDNSTKKRFREETIQRRLDYVEHNVKNVDFVDTASFIVSGYVYYPNVLEEGRSLPVQGAEIWVDDQQTSVKTDEDGYYAVPISLVKNYNFEAKIEGHTIRAEGQENNNTHSFLVNKDTGGINFVNTTLRDLYIDVHAYSDAPVGDWATVRVSSISPQLYNIDNGDPLVSSMKIKTHEDAKGNSGNEENEDDMSSPEKLGRIKIQLPPTNFMIQVDEVEGVLSKDQSVHFSLTAVKEELAKIIDTVDMNIIDSVGGNPVNKLSSFVYFGNVEVEVNEKVNPEEFFSQQYEIVEDEDGNFGGKHQILSEREKETLDIRLKHIYSYRGKSYDEYIYEGIVDITDEISDRGNEVVTLDISKVDGKATYEVITGKPYFDKPYTKNLTIVGYLNGRLRNLQPVTTKAIVVGELNRIGTFYTRTPEQPMFILHDPPGDQSYASLAKGTTKTIITDYMRTDGGSSGAMTDTKLGFGVWNPASGETGASLHFTMEQIAGRNDSEGSSTQTTYEFTQEFSTSSSEDYIGSDGDLYVGNSKNLTYALSDVLAYDRKNKKILKTVEASLDSVGFNTTFVYSEKHIKETLFGQIDNLIKIAEADSVISYQALRALRSAHSSWNSDLEAELLSSNEGYKKAWETHQNKVGELKFHQANKLSWEEIVEQNAQNKTDAEPFDNKDYLRNISFSAGASYTNSVMVDSMSSKTSEKEVFWEMSGSVGAYFIRGKYAESDIMAVMGAGVTWVDTDVTEQSNSQTVTFHLEDDDPGDFFSVDVLKDPMYGTPVFKLRAGTASCPPEEGAQMRAKASIVHTGSAIQANVPANEPAKFQVKMANMSESDEMMGYSVRVVSNKNLNGARILFAGQDITNGEAYFDLQAYTDEDKPEYIVPIELYKGSLDLEYRDIDIVMYPSCENDLTDYKDSPSKDYITLSATFQNPCSPVTLFKPGNNWIINQSHSNIMNFVLRDYDPSASSPLTNIRFEIRRLNSNGDWQYIGPTISKEELVANGSNTGIYQQYFDVSAYPNGDYEIRAVAFCSAGINYTEAVVGKIDRQSAVLYGIPTPANGILTKADIISVEYNKPIRNDGQTPINVSLMDLDTKQEIPARAIVSGNRIEIRPINTTALDQLENHFIEAKVWNVTDDASGNLASDTVNWSFVINRSNIYWAPNSLELHLEEGKLGKISSSLRNKTALDQTFSITKFPTWITPTVRNGRISPLAEVKIDFAIANTLNTGTYTDTISVINEGKEQLLYVKVHVLKESPKWEVDPSKYKYSMNMITQFVVDNDVQKFSEDVLDKVAVMVGDEVRGVAHIEYDHNLEKYYAFVTAYSNTPKEVFGFRFWDAQPGIEYTAVETTALVNGGLLGSQEQPFVLHPKSVVQTIPLQKGWNWISLYLENENMSLSNVLSSLKPSSGDLIMATVNDGKMSEYSQSLTEGWVGTLDSIDLYKSYRIYVSKADTLKWFGHMPKQEVVLPLHQGWNALGYTMPFNVELQTYFRNATFADSTRIVSQDEFAVYDADSKLWSGSLKYLRPNQGYRLITKGEETVFPYSTFGRYQVEGNNLSANMQAPALHQHETTIVSTLNPDETIDIGHFEGGMAATYGIHYNGEDLRADNLENKLSSMNRNRANGELKKSRDTKRASNKRANSPLLDRFEVMTYIDGKLTGVSSLQTLSNGEIRGFMSSSIESEMEGKEVEFILFDALADKRYQAKLSEKVNGSEGGRAGSISSPVMLMIEGLSDVVLTSNLESKTVQVGEEISYELSLKNTGEEAAVNVRISEQIPLDLSIVHVEATRGEVSWKGDTWEYLANNLAKGAEDQVKVIVKGNRVGVYHIGKSEALVNNDINLSNNSVQGQEIRVVDGRSNEDHIFIPTLITPNGDGINDVFEIVGLNEFITDVQVVIYNKSSTVVYRNMNYQNEWDGGNNPVGSYGYLIKGITRDGKAVEYTGYLSIVR